MSLWQGFSWEFLLVMIYNSVSITSSQEYWRISIKCLKIRCPEIRSDSIGCHRTFISFYRWRDCIGQIKRLFHGLRGSYKLWKIQKYGAHLALFFSTFFSYFGGYFVLLHFSLLFYVTYVKLFIYHNQFLNGQCNTCCLSNELTELV